MSDDQYAGMVAPAGDEFWPYTEAEADALQDLLAVKKQRALDLIIFSARLFAAQHERARKKPNPRMEILRLEAALKELNQAASELSNDADEHLKHHSGHGRAYDRPMDREDLFGAVQRFIHDNKSGFLEQPAKKPSAGRISDHLVQILVAKFDEAWSIGHGGKIPRVGWPTFISQCRAPLVRLQLLKNLDQEGKSVQKIRTKARRRNSI